MMRQIKLIILALCLYGTASGVAVAAIVPATLDIDFRTDVWSGCDSEPSCGPFGDITVTPDPTKPGLFWASDDGFGVRGGEVDEIDLVETLTVDFYTARTLTGVWFTDIFVAPDGGSNGEEAIVQLYSDAAGTMLLADFLFNAEEVLGTNNGGLLGDFGMSYTVKKVIFRSVNEFDDEYSVAGFVTAVPLPAALPLFLSALAGLALLGRRQRKKAAA